MAKEECLDFDEFTRRIGGKKKEAEFILYLKSLKVAEKIEEIDEEKSSQNGEYTPDFYIEFRDGYKMFLEIKHTDELQYEISGGNLTKRLKYAESKSLPLRFAISIKGHWMLLTSEQIKKCNGKVVIDNLLNSWLDIEFATCSYLFTPPLKVVSTYTRKSGSGLQIVDPQFGELISHKMYFDNKLVFEVNKEDEQYLFLMAFLEVLLDELSSKERWVVSFGDETIVTDKTGKTKIDFKSLKADETDEKQHIIIPEHKFFLSIMQHREPIFGVNNKDNVYSITEKFETSTQLVTVEYIRSAMLTLNDLGVPIFCFRKEKGYPIDEFQRKFWTMRDEDIK